MIRATTGGVLRNYRYNLMNSYINQNKVMNTLLTQRNFNSYAEDPASAAKAFRLRKSRMTVQSQYNICSDTYHKFQSAFKSLESVSLMVDNDTGTASNTLKGMTQDMLNDPTGDARTQLTEALDQVSEAIVQCMNQKYGDNFIFAGADGHNVPFEVREMEDGTKKLYYRNVPVDAAEPKLKKNNDNTEVLLNGDYLRADTTLVKASDVPEITPLEKDADGDPISVVAVDEEAGNVYYIKQGATGKTEEDLIQELGFTGPTAADLTDAEKEALEAEKAKYIRTSEFRNPLEDNKSIYYDPNDLVSKDTYDATYDGLMKDENGDLYSVTFNGDTCYIAKDSADATISDVTISQADYDTACSDAKKLEYLMDEKLYLDIGLGFQEKDGELIASSAFDAALIGINFFGYGVDKDGDPKNIYSLVQKMKEIAQSVPDGEDWDKATWDEFDHLVGKFETASSEFHTQFTNMDAGTTKLETNVDLLKENYYNLQEQYAELEDIEPVEVINNLLWAQYAYNAALKVGNSVLSQSLMDYLS